MPSEGDGEPDFPLLLTSTEGKAWVCKVSITRGTGQRSILPKLDREGMESMHAAITFVCIHATTIQEWLRVPLVPSAVKPPALFNRETDLAVMLGEVDTAKAGNSGSACAALALIAHLARLTEVGGGKGVAVTGSVDLRGRINPVDGIKEKCSNAQSLELGMMIIPQLNYQLLMRDGFSGWPDGLRSYAQGAMKPASDMLDVMQLVIPGEIQEKCLSHACDTDGTQWR